MMSRFDVPLGGILRIPFGSYNSSGASVTMTGLTVEDIRIYKDGALEERGPDAGYTVFTDFDGMTGLHIIEIDTSEDDSPAGFWTVGSEFNVFINAVTIDSQTVAFPAAWFRIVAAETSSGTPKVDVSHWLGTAAATPTTAGVPEVDVTFVNGSAVSTSSAQIGVNVVNAGGTAWASGSLTSGVFASGAITATAIAADAIGASELAADAVAEIADAVWDEDATAHQTQGTFGQAIGDPVADTNTIYKAVVTDATGVTVGTDTATMLASGNPVSSGGITTASFAAGAINAAAIAADAIGASELAADAVAEIADAVWDEDATAHQTTGTFGQAIGDPAANTATIYAATVTNAAGTDVAADIIAIKAETASILTDTTEIGTAGAGLTNINLPNQTMDIVGNITGNLSGSVGSVTGAVGSVTGSVGGNVTGSIGSLATQAKADVNAEVVDTLATDTYAEPGQGAPTATTTLAAKINYLYKAWRNKVTQTSTTYSLFADDASTVDQKATVSDDSTTFTKGEIATGP
jgi:hypothetical protein